MFGSAGVRGAPRHGTAAFWETTSCREAAPLTHAVRTRPAGCSETRDTARPCLGIPSAVSSAHSRCANTPSWVLTRDCLVLRYHRLSQGSSTHSLHGARELKYRPDAMLHAAAPSHTSWGSGRRASTAWCCQLSAQDPLKHFAFPL